MSHRRITEVSRPPEYASTTFFTRSATGYSGWSAGSPPPSSNKIMPFCACKRFSA